MRVAFLLVLAAIALSLPCADFLESAGPSGEASIDFSLVPPRTGRWACEAGAPEPRLTAAGQAGPPSRPHVRAALLLPGESGRVFRILTVQKK